MKEKRISIIYNNLSKKQLSKFNNNLKEMNLDDIFNKLFINNQNITDKEKKDIINKSKIDLL